MRINKLITGLLLLYIPLIIHAQKMNDSIVKFSLAEAKAYGMVNSPVIKNAALDLEGAKKKIWETTAIGLPQVNATMSFSYMISVPGFYEQFIKPGIGEAYQKMPVNDRPSDSIAFVNNAFDKAIEDMRFSGTLDFQVSQLIFSGAYIVGLQTAKVYKGLSEIALTKSKTEVLELLANSYYLVLIAKENKQITDSTYINMNKLLVETEALYKQGFLEETDVDQLRITVNNIKSAADMLTRQYEISQNMLKFQMGIPVEQRIELTDSLSYLLSNSAIEISLLQNFDVKSNPDFKLLESQAKLMNLNVKLQKSAYLPDIAAFYQHEKLLNDKAIAFTPPDMVGLSISLPLFTSGSRMVKVSQAKISYLKAVNTLDQVADGLKIDFENSKSTYINAKEKYDTEKLNFQLAQKILNKASIKFKQGMMSSADFTQAQNQYLQTQASYFTTALTLINARNKLERLLTKNN
jgi:outer membrane protein